MDEKELLALIEKDESQTVEFKESLSLKDDIGEAVSAFSNCNDGLIFVGVSDKREIVGVQVGKRTLEDLANYLKTHTDNHVFPRISVESIGDKKIVLIGVSKSMEKPVFFKGRAYGKVGKSVHKLSASEIRKLAKDSGEKVYWDSQVCKRAGLDDIDEEKIRWFLRESKEQRRLDVREDAPVREVLMWLGLMQDGKPTNAAVLLFGKNPQALFPQSEVRCVRFKGSRPVKPFIDMRIIGGDVIGQVDKALNFVLEHVPKAVWLAGGPQRKEKYQYPPDAVREAIINAVCHRDYEDSGNVQVRVFDDFLEVWNPGRLPAILSLDDLKKTHRSVPRNPSLAKCFFLVKFVESVGTGTNDIVSYCEEWGLPDPEFRQSAGDFVVTFRGRITEEYLLALGLNGRQIKAVNYVKENKEMSNRLYRRINGVGKVIAARELKDLVAKSILKAVGRGRSTKYLLND